MSTPYGTYNQPSSNYPAYPNNANPTSYDNTYTKATTPNYNTYGQAGYAYPEKHHEHSGCEKCLACLAATCCCCWIL